MSVPSQGQYVPHSVPLTLRKPISPQDRSRPRPLARPALPGPPRRLMSASTTRPIRHSIPLSLSIVARPLVAGLISSWRADSQAFVWLDAGITPCCKSRFDEGAKNSEGSTRSFRVEIGGTSPPYKKLMGDPCSATEVIRIVDRGA